MTLQEMITASNQFTDENISSIQAKQYANDAISIINGKVKTNLPFLGASDESYDNEILPETWQRNLLVTWLSYGIKMNDTSLSEAELYRQRFFEMLSEFAANVSDIIPEDYQGSSIGLGNKVKADISKTIDIGWFNSSNRGGN